MAVRRENPGRVVTIRDPASRPPAATQENVPTYDPDRYRGFYDEFSSRSGGSGGSPGFRERSVQGNETVQGQLAGLMADESEYIRRARMAGNRMAAARGSQAGSYYAGAAQGAAIDRALPIASQDAGWYGQTASDNMEAENRSRIVGSQNATSLANANISARSGIANALIRSDLEREQGALGRNFQRDENTLGREHDSTMSREDREWRSGEGALDRTFNAEQAERDRSFGREENDRNFIRTITTAVLGTIMSRPEYFRDPAGASGAMRFFTEEIGAIIADMFAGRRPTQPSNGLPSPGVPGG